MSGLLAAVASGRSGFVEAAAGCGKTELIANAVGGADGQTLILTHTHAGVYALRQRLKRLGVCASKYSVATIAGWALKYVRAYPETSRYRGDFELPATQDEWGQLYDGAARLVRRSFIADVLDASYARALVDEYQDCGKPQHALTLALRERLPVCLLGDPLQAIFGFGANDIVDWEADVRADFALLETPNKPWRWHEANPQLGEWLLEVRKSLLEGKPIRLQQAPIDWRRLPEKPQDQHVAQIAACQRAASNAGSTVAILQWEKQCHKLSRQLRGRFASIETVECADLLSHASAIESSRGVERVDAIVDFADTCLTRVRTELKSAVAAVRRGKIRNQTYKHDEQVRLLMRVREDDSIALVVDALRSIRRISGARLARRELFHEMLRSLAEFDTGEHDTVVQAVRRCRERTRRVGRSLGQNIIGRPVLVKGLEFDHAVILDADSMSARELYVSLTRGARTVAVLSRRALLQPKDW